MADAAKSGQGQELPVVAVLQPMAAGLVILDCVWCYIYVNNQAERILDMQRENYQGKTIWEMYPETVNTRFYRASTPLEKRVPGLGMGLYIVNEIVDRHGGKITVESVAGQGATFTVKLPISV